MIFCSHANKIHFQNKGVILNLVVKVKFFLNSKIVYYSSCSSKMRKESEASIAHCLRWHIPTSTKGKTQYPSAPVFNHTFLLLTRFLPHVRNPETKALFYLCWIYFWLFRLPSEEERRLPAQAYQNHLQPRWILLELFLVLLLDTKESEEWRYTNAVYNEKRKQCFFRTLSGFTQSILTLFFSSCQRTPEMKSHCSWLTNNY